MTWVVKKKEDVGTSWYYDSFHNKYSAEAIAGGLNKKGLDASAYAQNKDVWEGTGPWVVMWEDLYFNGAKVTTDPSIPDNTVAVINNGTVAPLTARVGDLESKIKLLEAKVASLIKLDVSRDYRPVLARLPHVPRRASAVTHQHKRR